MVLCIAFAGMHFSAKASHIIGGELYYVYLGGDQYEVTLTLYRECSASTDFDLTGRLTVFDANGIPIDLYEIPYTGRIPIPVELDSPCLTLPPEVCIEMTSYTTIMDLPAIGGGYHISFQRCCRQPNAVNIMNPTDIGITVTIQIPDQEFAANSSARFNALPPVGLCLNEDMTFDHSATDPDGDSLVYSLTTPYIGGSLGNAYPFQSDPPPYVPVPWETDYSESYQMDSSPPLSIDPVTGLLTVHPTLVGNYVIGVSVKEYRNGQLLLESIRDFLFSVVPCDATVEAAIAPQTQFCTGELTIPFQNNSIGGQELIWDFGVPDLSSDVSTEEQPIFTYPDYGTYTISLIVNPGAVCADTAIVTYALYPTPTPYFDLPDTTCGPLETVLTAEGMTIPNSTVAWYLGWGDPSFASTPQVEVTFPTLGVQPVTLTITEYGCTGFYDGSITAHPQPDAYFWPDLPSPQPVGASIVFTDGSNGNGAPITEYVWILDGNVVQPAGGNLLWEDALPGTHTISLQITTAAGCTDTYAITFMILPEEIIIPNVFTPNNDGENDLFVMENVQYYENELSIFNRWGNRVFDTANYRNNWGGLDLPDGTYYYELKLKDGRNFTGHVTILR